MLEKSKEIENIMLSVVFLHTAAAVTYVSAHTRLQINQLAELRFVFSVRERWNVNKLLCCYDNIHTIASLVLLACLLRVIVLLMFVSQQKHIINNNTSTATRSSCFNLFLLF